LRLNFLSLSGSPETSATISELFFACAKAGRTAACAICPSPMMAYRIFLVPDLRAKAEAGRRGCRALDERDLDLELRLDKDIFNYLVRQRIANFLREALDQSLKKLASEVESECIWRMKLFMVHCGFYDKEISEGFYESHTNFFVVAPDFKAARLQAKDHPDFKRKRMHIDGLQEVDAIQGYRIKVEKDESLGAEGTAVKNYGYAELRGLSQ
jgi:hypothetical protein